MAYYVIININHEISASFDRSSNWRPLEGRQKGEECIRFCFSHRLYYFW